MQQTTLSKVFMILMTVLLAAAAPTGKYTNTVVTHILTDDSEMYCLDSCAGISRQHIDDAITQFCTIYANSRISFYEWSGLPSYVRAFSNYGVGSIYFEVVANGGVVPMNSVSIGDFASCRSAFGVPTNECSISTTSMHGGIFNEEYLKFIITQNMDTC